MSPAVWLFAAVLISQFLHLIEHILVALWGQGLCGFACDNEETHLFFNGLIFVMAAGLGRSFRKNPWVIQLVVLTALHLGEHVYIYAQYLQTGIAQGPGLLGLGGAIGILPLRRIAIHNLYNGFEVVLLTLGFYHEISERLRFSEEIGSRKYAQT